MRTVKAVRLLWNVLVVFPALSWYFSIPVWKPVTSTISGELKASIPETHVNLCDAELFGIKGNLLLIVAKHQVSIDFRDDQASGD